MTERADTVVSFFRVPGACDDDRESRSLFLMFFMSLPRFSHESCIKVAVQVRGGVFKSTLVVDNDTTVHDVHTCTVAFSPSVLIKCSICSYHH